MRITSTATLVSAICWLSGADSVCGQATDASRLSLMNKGRPLMTYQAGYQASPDATAPWFGRSGFVHPVRTPAGRVVTEAFPRDHLHQHGLMFAWTSASFDGHPVDFWNSAKQTAHIEHAETVESGPDRIVVRLRHVDDTTKPPTVVLNETWELSRVPHPSLHVFDLKSTQTCATARPLSIGKYHYGAMCIRGPSRWVTAGATMLTSEGHDREGGNHTRPHWVALQGRVDGTECGIAAMSHPGNFRAPQPVRLHPRKPYFCFAPMVLGDFRIEPNSPYVSQFRFVAFDGLIDPDELNGMWSAYSDPDAR